MLDDATEIEKLNERLAIDGAARFEQGEGKLTKLVLTAPAGEAHVYRYGAHVTHYQPRGQRPVLFVSERASFTRGRPIRGGVPIIFPWFGMRASDPQSPLHGLARLAEWDVDSVTSRGETVTAVLSLKSTDEMTATWPHEFRLQHIVTIGPELDLTLNVTNETGEPCTFEQAMHTYFAVADVRRISVSGLSGTAYLDKNRNMEKFLDSDDPLVLTEPADRVYLGTRGKCIINDPAGGRRIIVDKEGSDATVVWNPWENPAKPIADLAADEWLKFICVETCNVKDYAVTLVGEATHTMRTIIRSEML